MHRMNLREQTWCLALRMESPWGQLWRKPGDGGRDMRRRSLQGTVAGRRCWRRHVRRAVSRADSGPRLRAHGRCQASGRAYMPSNMSSLLKPERSR